MYELCIHIDDCLRELHSNNKLAVTISRAHAINSPVISKSEIFCFAKEKNVYSYSVTMFTKRNYHLLSKMNSIIRRVMEFGLIQKWERDSDELQELKLSMAEADPSDDELVVLTVSHIAGALIVLAIGNVMALLVFFVELFVHSKVASGDRKYFWTLLNATLNSKRYFLNKINFKSE